MKRLALLLASLLALYAPPAFAQSYGSTPTFIGRLPDGTANCTAGTGNCAVTVANTQYLVAYSGNRNGCTIQNTNATGVLLVRLTNVDGTTTESYILAAGATFSCAMGPAIVGNRIDVTSTTAGLTYSATLF